MQCGFHGNTRQCDAVTGGVSRRVVRLAVHPEVPLFNGSQLLQLFMQHVDRLLHALALGHGHLTHTDTQLYQFVSYIPSNNYSYFIHLYEN